MSENNLKGIGEDEELVQDRDLEGIDAPDSEIAGGGLLEGISIRPEEQDIDPLQNILRGIPDPPQVDPEQLILEAQLARLTQLTEQNIILSQQRALLEQQRVEARKAETTSSGNDNAAEIRLGQFRKDFNIYYNLNAGGDDIVVQVSMDGNTWRDFETVSIPAAGEEDIAQGSTTYLWVRAYVNNSISDSDVNILEIVVKGD